MNRQVGQGEISIHQDEDEVMNQLVVGAFFMHPDEGLSICKEWIQVCDYHQFYAMHFLHLRSINVFVNFLSHHLSL